MGNECCSGRESSREAFTPEEKDILAELFEEICYARENSNNSKKFNKDCMKPLFPENPLLAEKIYKFMKFNNKDRDDCVDLATFISSLEVLIRSPLKQKYRQYAEANLEKIDIFVMINCGNYEITYPMMKEEYISYCNALEFVKTIIKMFQQKNSKGKIDDLAIKIIVDAAFGNDQGKITWSDMIFYLKRNLLYLNYLLPVYFENKFLHYKKPLNIKIPELCESSHILTSEIIGIICMSNTYLQNASKLELVYGSDTPNFDLLAEQLLNYHSATIIILKLSDTSYNDPRNYKGYTIAGFIKNRWNEGIACDPDATLFALIPKYKTFPMLKENINSYNLYFNRDPKTGLKGLGFGKGNKPEEYRLWLDGQNKESKMFGYVNDHDDIFESGFLAEPCLNKIKIQHVEVWGLGIEFTASNETRSAARNTIEKKKLLVREVPKSSGVMRKSHIQPSNNEVIITEKIVIDKTVNDKDIDMKFDEIFNETIRASIKQRPSFVPTSTTRNSTFMINQNNSMVASPLPTNRTNQNNPITISPSPLKYSYIIPNNQYG